MDEGHSTSRLELWRQHWRRLVQRARGIALFALGMLAALAALLIYNTFVLMPRQLTENDVNHTVAQALASATPPPAISAQVYQVIRPSLVLIQTQLSDKDGKPEYGIGSGVIVDDSGDILTSLHVVADATEIKLTFADGTESTGQVAARQPEDDIAVVRADTPPSQLAPAILGNPNTMNVGDEAYAVGNPFGLYSSMSAGVISGFNRTFEPTGSSQKLQGLIQIDAAVNPGNSGGPLLNRYGQVIGIVTGIVNPTDQNFFVGIGFAVPITIAGRAAGSPPY